MERLHSKHKNGGKKRRKQFDPECFQDNGLSIGGRVKEDGQVIHNLLRNHPKGPNMRCRIENFGEVVSDFGPDKRKWVEEMGFAPLFSLAHKGLPRTLCYWLATRVDVENLELVSYDKLRFPLSPRQVHWVLGLPIGGQNVPNQILDELMAAEEKLLRNDFLTYTDLGTAGIAGKDIENIVKKDVIGEREFKRAFLMFVLNEVLCPTTCHRLSMKLIPAVTIFENAAEYDWCKLTLDHLMFYLAKFAKTFHSRGYAKGVGGCTIFLAVFYLDKLYRNPVGVWDSVPRIEAWTKSDMIKIQSLDRFESGDFGKLGCVDAAYGVRHPKEPKDEMPKSSAIAANSSSYGGGSYNFYMKQTVFKKVRRRKDCSLNPFGINNKEKKEKRMRPVPETDTTNCPSLGQCNGSSVAGRDSSVNVENPTLNVFISTQQLGFAAAGSVDDGVTDLMDGGYSGKEARDFMPDPLDLGVSPKSLSVEKGTEDYSSRPQQKDGSAISDCETEVSCTSVEDEEGFSDAGPEDLTDDAPPGFGGVPLQSEPCTPIVSFFPVGSESGGNAESPVFRRRSRKQRRCRSSLKLMPGYIKDWRPMHCRVNKKKIIDFVTNYVSSDSVEPVLIRCADVGVGVSYLRAVLSEDLPLSEEYVHVAADLYTKVWEKRFVGRSKKIILPPQFASACLSDGCGAVTYQRLMHLSNLSPGQWINMLIIPVHNADSSWWALTLSFNRSEVIIMDSSGAPLDSRRASVHKLVGAIDSLLRNVVPSWKFGVIPKWHVTSVTYLVNVSRLASGVMMLRTLKKSADRIPSVIQKELSMKDREWLLCEDVMSEFNVERDYVRQLIGAK